MTTPRLNHLLPAGAVLALALGLAGCGSPEDSSGPGGTTGATDEATTEAATTEDESTTDDSTTDDDAAIESDDVTAAGLAAIATAERDTGGVAFAIDRDDDGDEGWDVDVRTGDTMVEVEVSADGTSVVRSEDDDLDGDDRAAIDAAEITLTEAIEIAVAETGGVLDDAELSDDDNPLHYEVTVDTADRDDVDVDVDAVTGEVLRVS
ncbi:PepSY domain-containing protein [Pseudactinotalea sp.]|uniref:PepSY domain-containing protein n=1 Tax=Pseudactinotalea sp. TaxID=1926260 RepID=UPI003B3A338E